MVAIYTALFRPATPPPGPVTAPDQCTPAQRHAECGKLYDLFTTRLGGTPIAHRPWLHRQAVRLTDRLLEAGLSTDHVEVVNGGRLLLPAAKMAIPPGPLASSLEIDVTTGLAETTSEAAIAFALRRFLQQSASQAPATILIGRIGHDPLFLNVRRTLLQEDLKPAPPIQYAGRQWNLVRIDGDVVHLASLHPPDRYVRPAALEGYTARFEGRSWKVVPSGAPHRMNLQDLETGEVRQIHMGDLIDPKLRAERVAAGSVERDGGARFEDPETGIVWRPLVGTDRLADRMRLRAVDPKLQTARVALTDLEAPLSARLVGREREGLFTIAPGPSGLLIASRGTERLPVQPREVLGEQANRPSFDFGLVPVRTTHLRYVDDRTGFAPPAGADHSSVHAALASYGLGALPSGAVSMRSGLGNELLHMQADFVRSLAPGTPLVLRQWLFSCEDLEDPSRPNRAMIQAIIEHARHSPTSLIVGDGNLACDLEARLKAAGVHISVPRGHNGRRLVIHQKNVVTRRLAIAYTGSCDDKTHTRVDLQATLPEELAEPYFAHEQLAATIGHSRAVRRTMLEALAKQGLAIDSPDVGAYFATRSYWAITRGAQRSIDVYVKMLADPDYTGLLLEKAWAGIPVRVVLFEHEESVLDRVSARRIRKALAEEPDLPLSVERFDSEDYPYVHFSAVIVDDEVGIAGALYPWSPGLTKVDPAGVGAEQMLIFQGGEDIARLRQQIQFARGLVSGFEPYFQVNLSK